MHATSPGGIRKAAAASPVSLVLFDLLHLDGAPLVDLSYDQRRGRLEQLDIGAPGWAVTPSFTEEKGRDVLRSSIEIGMEGVVAKRRSSRYQPGRRSRDWIKVKSQSMQEVVIGGFTRGNGSRRSDFGALILGLPITGSRKLSYVGKVGTGFSEQARAELIGDLGRLVRATSPFDVELPAEVRREAVWVTPNMVGEVRFSERTPDGRFRHPVWRGLRPDRTPDELRRGA